MKHNLPYIRRSSQTDSRNNSPRGMKSPRYGTSEFFASLETQIKRLDPDFFFIWGDESPLTQALTCIKQGIDKILTRASNSDTNFSSNTIDSPTINKKNTVDEKSVSNKLKQMEFELSKKFEESEKKAEKLVKEKEKLRKMKKTLFELEDELRNVKEELNNEFLQLNQKKNKFRSEKEELEKEKVEIKLEKKMILEAKLGIDQRELEFKAVYDDLELKKEIFLQEREEIDRDQWILQREKEDLLQKQKILEKAREQLAKESKYLDQEKSQFLQQRQKNPLTPFQDPKVNIEFIDESNSPSFSSPSLCEMIPKHEFEKLQTRIHEELFKAENSLIYKAMELDDREEQILQAEKIIEDKLYELQIIKETLARSSSELNEMIQLSFPKVTNETKYVEKLLFQLSETQRQLLNQSETAKEEQNFIESIKSLTEEEKILELQKMLKIKLEYVSQREKIVNAKMNETEKKQRELEGLEEKLRTEQFQLKCEHENRMVEIEDAKNEILNLQEKLEQHMKKMDQKERKIFEAIQIVGKEKGN